jgi:hypothetical protein
MIDHPVRLVAAAFLGVFVSLPADAEAGSMVSRSAGGSPSAFSARGGAGGSPSAHGSRSAFGSRGSSGSPSTHGSRSALGARSSGGSPSTHGSKAALSQPFGQRTSPSVENRLAPRGSDRGNDYGRGKDSDRHSSRDSDRYRDYDDDDDRYHGDKDRHHGHHDCDKHGWGHDHHRHHYYDHHYSRYYYPPSIFFGFGIPAAHTHHIGCGHVGYWCDHCHFHTTAVEIFYDHVHLAHSISVSAIPNLLIWNPVNLVFVFD